MKKHLLFAIIGVCAILSCAAPKEQKMLERTLNTQKLYTNMQTLEGVMFGHQDATVYGHNWYNQPDSCDVKSVCGSYPAVYGWELGDLELGKAYSLDSVYFDTIRQRIVEAYERGGINSISWHCNNPLTGQNAWDVSNDSVVASVLPGGSKETLYKEYLAKMAKFLNSLKSKSGEKIPVLFRPYHEHTGSWFWWGQKLCSPQQYIELWKMTRQEFDKNEVDNVLYIYSPSSQCDSSAYFERYPGDEYVDILGIDCYCGNNTEKYVEESKSWLKILASEAARRNKVACYSETGLESITDPNWWTNCLLPSLDNYKIAYVLVWRNAWDKENHFYAPYPGQNSVTDFLKFKENPRILFEDRLNNMYE